MTNNSLQKGKKGNKIKRRSRVVQRKVSRAIKNQPLSKKIGIPTKIILSILLIYFLVLSYFLLVIYLKPRSVPAITDKINQALEENLGSNYRIKSSLVSFNSSANLVISTKEIQEIDLSEKKLYISKVNLGEISVEIPLIRIIFFNFKPKVITINDSVIEANYFFSSKQANEDKKSSANDEEDVLKSNKLTSFINSDLQKILTKELPINQINLNNVELNLKKDQKLYDKIVINKSSLKILNNGQVARFISNNNVKFNSKELDVYFNFGCQIELKQKNYPECNLNLQNIKANSLAKISSKLSFLEPIDALFEIDSYFQMTDLGFDDVKFGLSSKDGNFNYDQFFDGKIYFTNLVANGSYQEKLGIINLEKIQAQLRSEIKNDVDLEMSLLISGLNAEQFQDFDFKIKLENVSGSEIAKFWPISLPRQDIRDWVANHIEQGLVSKAYTNFKLTKEKEESFLDSIQAKIEFSGLKLAYDEFFPEITNMDGLAKFDKGSMYIELDHGQVLETKIDKASVAIKDFFAPVNLLEIKASSIGASQDLFKHINYRSNYSQNIKNFINGRAASDIAINIPLVSNLDLKDVEIDIKSQIADIQTDFIDGQINVECQKKAQNNSFITKIDLENAKLKIPAFAIEKEPKIPANLDLSVVVDQENVKIRDIALVKINDLSAFGGKIRRSEISGSLNYNLESQKIDQIILKNYNFGNNDYKLEFFDKKSQKNYKIFGQKLDLTTLINYQLPFDNSNKVKLDNSQFTINIVDVGLMNDKKISNLYAYLECQVNFCRDGLIKANYDQNKFINLNLVPNQSQPYSNIKGRITDVSYLAEGLGVTNLLQGGDFEVEATNNLIDNKNKITGKFKALDKVIFFETSKIKDLAQDDLFSQVKDTIFASGKTIFSNMSGEFEIAGQKILVNSFVANNFKVGITAKGNIDLNQKGFNFKGMIVPGYIVNNLFGIGKIPIVGNVVTGLLTGGEEGGGLFGIRYSYSKESKLHKEKFKTEKVKSFIPSSIKNLFD